MDTYLFLRLVHIISSTLLFGTGLGTAYYMWNAHRSGDVAAIVHVSRQVVLADWLFTTPAVIVQPVTGLWMMSILGYGFDLLWIKWSLGLYVLTGACWLPVVWLQMQAHNISKQAQLSGGNLPSVYYRYMRYWFMLGWPAFIAVIAVFVLMVFKPV